MMTQHDSLVLCLATSSPEMSMSGLGMWEGRGGEAAEVLVAANIKGSRRTGTGTGTGTSSVSAIAITSIRP
jgi:hypothetical protein